MMRQLETQRLLLRPFTWDDFENLYQINSNPEIMRYIRSPETREQTQESLKKIIDDYEKFPALGRLAIIEKSTNTFIGLCLLRHYEIDGEIEAGYVLTKQYWGKGYATEAMQELLRYGFDDMKFDCIVAVCMPTNEASWRVMEKVGMRRVGYVYIYNNHDLKYEIRRNQSSLPNYIEPIHHRSFTREKDGYLLTTDKSKLHLGVIFNYLHHESYWAKGIPKNKVEQSFNNSLTFGILKEGNQVAFARIISDFATFALLADVFVLPEHRGQGLSKWLVQIIMQYPDLQGLRRWSLATHDAHTLYAQYGFELLPNPERWMQIYTPYQ